jgi:hypothetical protein
VPNNKLVKDKRIEGNNAYLAVVEYYQDSPARDGHTDVQQLFETLPGAQKFLAKFPRDIWDGFDSSDYRLLKVSINDKDRCGRVVDDILDLFEEESDLKCERAFDRGYSEGFDDGESENEGQYDEGYEVGYDVGYTEGLDEGLDEV